MGSFYILCKFENFLIVMSVELLPLNKKKTDILIEGTKTNPQKSTKYKVFDPMQTFSFDTTLKIEEDKRSLG